MQTIRKLDFERHMYLLRVEARDGNFTRRDIDERQLAGLTKNARRFLARRVCGGCEMPLDRTGCGSYLMPPCPWRGRWKRRRRCLATYKPRPRRAA